jgi:hypothetical protein
MANGGKAIKVKVSEKVQGGVYANSMVVRHGKEEFVLDFLFIAPPEGAVMARVITSPGHMKRIIEALQTNMNKYEQNFGKLKPAEEPKGIVGFTPPGE